MARKHSGKHERGRRGAHSPKDRRVRQNISSIAPVSRGTESDRTYQKRTSQKDYRELRRHKSRRRRIALIAAAAVGVLLIGLVVGAWAYIGSVNHKMGSDVTPEVAAALAERETPQDPFYMVVLGKDARPGETQSRSDTLMLVRVDPEKKTSTIVSIPRDTKVNIEGYGSQKINAAAAHGGVPLVISTVSDFAGVPISHYMEVDFNGFQSMVDTLGGVVVDVPVPISDPQAGPDKLKPGEQLLNGSQALTFCRSRAFPTGDFARVEHQQLFLKALARTILAVRDPLKLSSLVGDVAGVVKTDLTVGDMYSIAKSMGGMNLDEDLETVTVPATTKTIGGVSYVIADDEGWQAMIKRIEDGLPADPEKAAALEAASTAEPASEPSSISVTVRNGAGIEGVATDAATKLTAVGYKIAETGNANQFVYDETLVVYNEGGEADAEAVVETLGMGKAVPSRGMYTFTGDILVVVGKDWRP